jgi:MarR family transcriptional regulator, lower aerobic nicotinate degradation pathway regulator
MPTDVPPAPAAYSAAPPASVLIARVARVVRQRFDRALEPTGLRQRQLVALGYLREHGPTPQQALAQSLCMDASSLVCLLNELEDRELISRSRDRADRRRGILMLTEEGQETMEQIDRTLLRLDEEILSNLDEEERGTLRALLSRLWAGEVDWNAAAKEEARP